MHSFHIEWRKSSFSQNENCVEVADLRCHCCPYTQHRDLMLLFRPLSGWRS